MATNISKDASGRITVSFPYDPQLVLKVKNSGTKCLLFPFVIAIQDFSPVIARHKVPKQSPDGLETGAYMKYIIRSLQALIKLTKSFLLGILFLR
jgi:hypothetical protein